MQRSACLALAAALALGVAAEARAVSGSLSFVEAYFDGEGLDGLDGAEGLATSPDGAHLYVAGSQDRSLVVFARDAATGQLGFVERKIDDVGGVEGLVFVEDVELSPDGAHVYGVSGFDRSLVTFSRDPATGALAFVQALYDEVGGVDGLDGANHIAPSPDGAHLYVTSASDDAVAAFSRDAATGQLAFVQEVQDGVGGVDGLDFGQAVVVSPDGAHVYVVGKLENALLSFTRDPGTGVLNYIETLYDGTGGITGLYSPRSIAISPGGAHVYVGGGTGVGGDGALVLFSRNAATGQLSFVDALIDTAGDHFGWSNDLAVSPDGLRLYGVRAGGDALAAVARDPATGLLSFVDSERDGEAGLDGLDFPEGVAVSPDGAHVYVAGKHDDAVVAFHTFCGDGLIEAPEECDDGNATDADGCDADCTLGACFTCSGEPTVCTPDPPPCCGNSLLEAGEQCDDGNADPGDCCSASCQYEAGQGAPSCCDQGVCRTGSSCGQSCLWSGGCAIDAAERCICTPLPCGIGPGQSCGGACPAGQECVPWSAGPGGFGCGCADAPVCNAASCIPGDGNCPPGCICNFGVCGCNCL